MCIGYYIVYVKNVKDLWKITENWVRLIYDFHFKIANIENKFKDKNNNPAKQLINLSVNDVICSKTKTGKKMTL